MPAGYAFRPRAWAFVLATAGCAAGIALGNWQSERAAQKRASGIPEVIELRGEFVADRIIYLDNKVSRGMPGYDIVQPLRLSNGRHVLVDRGWTEMGADRARLPEVRTPVGEVTVAGARLPRFARAYALEIGIPKGLVWQNVTLEQFAAWSGLALEPYVIVQTSGLADGLTRERPRAAAGAEMHESYALQWYSLAALSLILFLALNLKIEKRKS